MFCGQQNTDFKFHKTLNCKPALERASCSKARPPDCQRSSCLEDDFSSLRAQHGNRCCRQPSSHSSNFFQLRFAISDAQLNQVPRLLFAPSDSHRPSSDRRGTRKIWTWALSCKGFSGKKFQTPKIPTKHHVFAPRKPFQRQSLSPTTPQASPTIKKDLAPNCNFHLANLQELCPRPPCPTLRIKSSKHSALGLKRDAFRQTKCCFEKPTHNPPCSSSNQA